MFMTPLIFHAIDFSAREVGSGLAVSALIGTVVRLLSGALLDRGIRCSWPVRGTTLLAIAADLILLQADNYNSYLLGQLLLGCAAGLYWPAAGSDQRQSPTGLCPVPARSSGCRDRAKHH